MTWSQRPAGEDVGVAVFLLDPKGDVFFVGKADILAVSRMKVKRRQQMRRMMRREVRQPEGIDLMERGKVGMNE